VNIVILVPRRAGFPDRDALWDFCKPWWREQFPDWPIYEGHHDIGLFNRSAAVNEASRLAGEWDVAVLIDSDVLTEPARVRQAIPIAVETGQMVVPFSVRYNLNGHGTKRILAGDRGSWKGYIARQFRDQHSSVIVIPRTLWDDIGGFDEGFQGWGMEDSAFAVACEVIAGRKLERLPGEVWHLYHDSPKGEKHGSPSHRRNMARLHLYEQAWSYSAADRATIQRLVVEGREVAALPTESIPRILHRVVPAHINATAEVWWGRFATLHPSWQLLTHRDPLDPAEWPLTAPSWSKVSCGAQLADLVRLEALLRWGGVYVDQDMEPFRSLEPLLSAQVFAAWEDEQVVPNAVIGARPGHPLISEMLTLALRSMKRSVWDAGPGATTKVLTGRTDVLLLPPSAFYAVHYRDPERDRKMSAPASPWEFARHHYWGSWLPEERRKVPA
jgi:hypothetical protein